MHLGVAIFPMALIWAAAVAQPVLPTAPVLAWQLNQTGCFVHYNMATMAGTQGCQDGVMVPPPLSSWQPSALDTDAWVRTCKALGGSRIIYVAKHGCGFAAWRSQVEYNYSVTQAPDRTDVVASFVKSARAAGLGLGFYYSDATNCYCRVRGGAVQPGDPKPGQIKVTQEEYDAIVVAHLGELWGNYGPLDEIWFDGGYHATLKSTLAALLQRLQPNAVVFGGAGISPNALRWIGTESGYAPYPAWSRTKPGDNGQGDPDGAAWYPAETDFTLQNGDSWFFNGNAGVHAPAELRQMYEQSAGGNTGLIIDMAPFPNGSVPAAQTAAANALGAYVRGCYGGVPVASGKGLMNDKLTIGPAGGGAARVNRVQVRENQSLGQSVRAFNLSAVLANGSTVPLCPTKRSSIGANFICALSAPLVVKSLTLAIGTSAGVPYIAGFAAFDCSSLAAAIDARW